MSSFVLKMIGILSMLFDHSGYLIFGQLSFLNYIGRLAFPIFAFGISEGYTHTRDVKKYLVRLGIFALVSQIPYSLYFSQFSSRFCFNIFFTLFLGLLAIIIYDKCNQKWLGLLAVLGITCFALFLPFDYSWYGVALIFSFYALRNRKITCMIVASVLISLFHFLSYWGLDLGYHAILLWLFTLLSLVFIAFYNGKKGKDAKYILYLFYPLHLIVLYFIYVCLH